MDKRTLMELSEDEMASLVNDPLQFEIIRTHLTQALEELRYEVGRIDNVLASIQQSEGTGLTLIGLLSLLVFLVPTSTDVIEVFLIFILPFLLIGIFSFYHSSSRRIMIRENIAVGTTGKLGEILVLRTNTKITEDIFITMMSKFEDVLRWHRWHTLSLKVFTTSFFILLYLRYFYGTPSYSYFGVISTIVVLFWSTHHRVLNWGIHRSYPVGRTSHNSNS